jgi:hypothetical protein
MTAMHMDLDVVRLLYFLCLKCRQWIIIVNHLGTFGNSNRSAYPSVRTEDKYFFSFTVHSYSIWKRIFSQYNFYIHVLLFFSCLQGYSRQVKKYLQIIISVVFGEKGHRYSILVLFKLVKFRETGCWYSVYSLTITVMQIMSSFMKICVKFDQLFTKME